MKTPPTPKPVVVTTICSMCGLGWDAHGPNPTTEDCIRLLKAELASRPVPSVHVYPRPWPYPYQNPYVTWGVAYDNVPVSDAIQFASQSNQATVGYNTPTVSINACVEVAA